uniref:Uncharacterized protein n=1 Tax=Anguilla anguilla TaxID=7936 RepID=A0A0E9VJY4_ANGAN
MYLFSLNLHYHCCHQQQHIKKNRHFGNLDMGAFQ